MAMTLNLRAVLSYNCQWAFICYSIASYAYLCSFMRCHLFSTSILMHTTIFYNISYLLQKLLLCMHFSTYTSLHIFHVLVKITPVAARVKALRRLPGDRGRLPGRASIVQKASSWKCLGVSWVSPRLSLHRVCLAAV